MIYVGIDVAKNKHDYCILGMDGECLCRPFSFDNDSAGAGLWTPFWNVQSILSHQMV